MAGYTHLAGPASSTTNGQLGQLAAASTSSAGTSSSFTTKISDFIERNKRALTIAAGASVVVTGAAGYYYYTRPVYRSTKTADSDDGLGGDEGEESPLQRKKGKKKKSKKSAGNVSSPATTSSDIAGEKAGNLPTVTIDVDSQSAVDSDLSSLTSAQIASFPEEKRRQVASELKTKGNKAYSAKRYRDAIDIYSKAIECDEQAVYYSNRAACFTNLGRNEEVVRDCSEALRLDPGYVKALNRRGQAREAMGGEDNLFNALCDFTAGAIIDGFQNESMATAVDRVMKQLAQEKASKIMKDREPRLPTPTFIKAYMEAFRPKPRPDKPENPTQGEETLFLAFDALDARDYHHALSLFGESIEQGISNDILKARALNMTGTFKFIIGEASAALVDLEESTTLDPTFTQTWVKKASVHMELSTPELAFESFEKAVKVDKDDPDIYYHRGQVYFITGQFEHAISEYRRSTELDKTFVFSQIQLAVAIYKKGSAEKAMRIFQRIIEDFGQTSPEVYNYYGEILMDRGEFTAALENLDKSITLERQKKDPRSPLNVLPMVNKALCLYQSKQALEEAESICRNALEIDPGCDIAVATLGQLLLQQNKVREAVKSFERSAEIARTEMELQNALAYENATRAQLDFIEKYPEYAHKLGLAQARM